MRCQAQAPTCAPLTQPLGGTHVAVAIESGNCTAVRVGFAPLQAHTEGDVPCAITRISSKPTAFEVTSKRRKGFPSESRVKRGERVVGGSKELLEKLGRNDPCPCNSGRRFQALLHADRSVRWLRPCSLLLDRLVRAACRLAPRRAAGSQLRLAWRTRIQKQTRPPRFHPRGRTLSSTASAMSSRITLVLTVFTVAAGCTTETGGAIASADLPQSVCALPTIHRSFTGMRVQVRGRFDVHAHGVSFKDERCPGIKLFLKPADDEPDLDLSLCTPERLAQEFGCPGGNRNGPIVTVVGIISMSKDPRYGWMTVSEMRDFENVRTGERFTP